MAKPRSKQIKTMAEIGKMPPEVNYCRKCGDVKSVNFFHSAMDYNLDSNKKLSICKDCCDLLFDGYLKSEGSIEKAILKMCRLLNIQYNTDAIEAAKKQIESKGIEESGKLFGMYKAKLIAVNKTSIHDSAETMDLSFKYETQIVLSENPLNDEDFDEAKELKLFWGTEDRGEIEFLESEFTNFKRTHKADTYAEITLLKEVCHKLWDINKDRRANKSTDSSVKQLMEVMKSLAISPNSSNAAGDGKNKDTFGVWTAEIMKFRPEEWVENRSIYRDVDNIEEYNEKIFLSPMRSLITGNREFSLDAGEENSYDEEGE